MSDKLLESRRLLEQHKSDLLVGVAVAGGLVLAGLYAKKFLEDPARNQGRRAGHSKANSTELERKPQAPQSEVTESRHFHWVTVVQTFCSHNIWTAQYGELCHPSQRFS